MNSILKLIAEHQVLSRADAGRAMNLLLTGEAPPEHIAALLLGLRARGETIEELTGFTEVMRSHAVPVALPSDDALDIVGTGGDGFGTFNISTTAALVCAGAGVMVAKHGSRSASSKCGSSEVLDELGVETNLGSSGVEFCLKEAGIAFMYAPVFHPAMKHVMEIRKSLAVRTCFNILGPLCNPANVKQYMVGAFSLEVAELMAHILYALGAESLITVHAENGMDEVSISGPTTLFMRLKGHDELVRSSIDPTAVGLSRASVDDVVGGDSVENAGILCSILDGTPGPRRDIVVLNAGVALYTAGKAASFRDGVDMAIDSIDSDRAKAKLDSLIAASREAPAESGGQVRNTM